MQHTAPVSQVRARVYVEAPVKHAAVRVGMIGFDHDWRWRDDGFIQLVPVGDGAEITWQLAEPGVYREIGLKFPADAALTVYLGQIEIRP